MPRVPTRQEGVQAAPLQPLGQTSAATPELLSIPGRQMQQFGAALNDASAAAQRVKERDDADAVFQHEAQLRADYIQFESDTKKSRRADQAKGVTNDVEKWWQEQSAQRIDKIPDGRQRHLLNQTVTRMRLQSLDNFRGYEDAQGEISHDTNWKASKELILSQAAADPKTVPSAIIDIQQKNAYFVARRGLGVEVKDAMDLADTTKLHSEVIKGLVTGDPTAAKNYFEANKKQINGTSYDEITKLVDTASAANDGEKAAGAAWEALGPKGYNDPVLLDKMEAQIRQQYPNDHARAKAGIGALRERVAAHNSTQGEVKAGAINAVMDKLMQSGSLAAVQKTPEWQALGGADRMKITEHWDARQTAALNRSNAADESNQRALRRKGFGAYLAYSNTDTLAGMSEAQVQALLPDLGNELTGHLMEKKRGLASAEAKVEAKVDQDDFNAAAARMGLKPYDNGKSDHEKAAIGELKFRVEQLIDTAQRTKKGPLTRAEKNELINQEMARKVSLPGFWSDTAKPVITLSAEELTKIKVPDTDRAQISDAMRSMYGKTKDARYAPTEANLKRWYALNKSRSAALIPDAQ
jgi:hypothetical protein